MIAYKEFTPDAQLAPYVDSYWLSTGNTGNETISYGILPDCCCDILLNLGDSVLSSNANDTIIRHKAYIIGAATRFSEVEVTGSVAICGIRFKPLGMLPFMQRLQMGEFKDNAVDIDLVNKLHFEDFFDGVDDNYNSLKQRLDAFLLSLFNPGYIQDNVVKNALSIISQKKGIIKVTDLAGLVNTSARNLERLFYKNVGLAPKEFAQISRLKNISKEIRTNNNKSLGQIAYEYNYYDSAHFTRDFTAYAGSLPSRY